MRSPNSPVVTIHCVTYNHGDFLREALDSFLMQKTNFPFEIIIHDDVSTDGTRETIREYQKKHPNIIKPLFEKENQFSQGKDDFIKKMFLMSEGLYIAQCEGDDFWTDENKLQKQVDFLEANKDYALCFHPVKVFFQNSDRTYLFPEGLSKKDFTLNSLIGGNFIQSNSVLYRAKGYSDIRTGVMPYDWYMLLYHAQFGKIGYLNETMSAYRRHDQGVWWEVQRDITKIWRQYGIGHLKLYQAMLDLFGDDQKKHSMITMHINTMLENIFNLEDADDVKHRVAVEFPDETQRYISDIQKKYINVKAQFDAMSPQYEALNDEYGKLIQHSKNVENQLELIHSSRVWRARNKVAHWLGRG